MVEDIKKINNEGVLYLAVMNSELGFINHAKQDSQKALGYLKDAYEYFSEQFRRVDPEHDASGEMRNNLKKNMFNLRNKIVETLMKLADAKMQNKDYYGAIEYYKQTLYYNLKQGELFYKLGKCLAIIEAFNIAHVSLENALELGYTEENDIYRFLGDICINKKKDAANAIKYYRKYLEKDPKDSYIYNQLGHSYDVLDPFENLDLQIECFEKASALRPDVKGPIKNLAIVYPRLDKYDETLECYRKILKMGPSMDDLFDYACMLIKLGNFEEGWKYYEHRFAKENGPTPYPKIKRPKWKGQKINGQTLLVHWEQGLGDTIFFARYLSQLREVTNKIIFRVQDSMIDMLKLNYPDIEFIGDSTPVENIKFDYHVPLMSLPHILKARMDNIPFTEGYLKADKQKSEFYKKEYFNNDCLKIGISWQGATVGNQLRNVPFEKFYPLAKLKNVKVYSFQKGINTDIFKQLPEGVEIIDLGSTFRNFNDTAAAMDNIDIFISSDNCVPNLAGAMGKETVLLMHKNSEWRWFLDEKTTPWYKSFKLLKKKNEKDDWALLIDEAIKNYLPKEALKV